MTTLPTVRKQRPLWDAVTTGGEVVVKAVHFFGDSAEYTDVFRLSPGEAQYFADSLAHLAEKAEAQVSEDMLRADLAAAELAETEARERAEAIRARLATLDDEEEDT